MDTNAEKKKVLLVAACGLIFVIFMLGSVVFSIMNHSKERPEAKVEKVETTTDVSPEPGAVDTGTDRSETAEASEDASPAGEQKGTGSDAVTENPSKTTPELYDPSSLKLEKVTKEVKDFIGVDYDRLRPELYSYLVTNKISAKRAILMDGTNINKKKRITLNFQTDSPAASKIQVTYTVKSGTYNFVVW